MHSKIFNFLWSESILETNYVFDLNVQRRATIKTIFKQVYGLCSIVVNLPTEGGGGQKLVKSCLSSLWMVPYSPFVQIGQTKQSFGACTKHMDTCREGFVQKIAV